MKILQDKTEAEISLAKLTAQIRWHPTGYQTIEPEAVAKNWQLKSEKLGFELTELICAQGAAAVPALVAG